MDIHVRLLRLQQLDDTLMPLANGLPPHPPAGWVKSVREALGLTLESLGRKLGCTKEAVRQLESAEVRGAITINRLRAAADALGCDVQVVLVPRKPLHDSLWERARQIARQQLRRVNHSMVMEDQALLPAQLERLVEATAREIIETNDPRLWK